MRYHVAANLGFINFISLDSHLPLHYSIRITACLLKHHSSLCSHFSETMVRKRQQPVKLSGKEDVHSDHRS